MCIIYNIYILVINYIIYISNIIFFQFFMNVIYIINMDNYEKYKKYKIKYIKLKEILKKMKGGILNIMDIKPINYNAEDNDFLLENDTKLYLKKEDKFVYVGTYGEIKNNSIDRNVIVKIDKKIINLGDYTNVKLYYNIDIKAPTNKTDNFVLPPLPPKK